MTSNVQAQANAMGGTPIEVFGQDATGARACCADCGAVNELASLTVEDKTTGKVMRCPDCGTVMFVAAEGPAGLRFSFGSVRWIETVQRSFHRSG